MTQYTTYVPTEFMLNVRKYGFMDGVTLDHEVDDAKDGRFIIVVNDEHAPPELEGQLVDTLLSLDPGGRILIHSRRLVE